MATSRIDMRIDESVKAAAEKAAALKGINSLTEYVVRLIKEDSERIIAEHEMTLKDDIFDRFVEACEKAKTPNKKLRNALEFSQEKGLK